MPHKKPQGHGAGKASQGLTRADKLHAREYGSLHPLHDLESGAVPLPAMGPTGHTATHLLHQQQPHSASQSAKRKPGAVNVDMPHSKKMMAPRFDATATQRVTKSKQERKEKKAAARLAAATGQRPSGNAGPTENGTSAGTDGAADPAVADSDEDEGPVAAPLDSLLGLLKASKSGSRAGVANGNAAAGRHDDRADADSSNNNDDDDDVDAGWHVSGGNDSDDEESEGEDAAASDEDALADDELVFESAEAAARRAAELGEEYEVALEGDDGEEAAASDEELGDEGDESAEDDDEQDSDADGDGEGSSDADDAEEAGLDAAATEGSPDHDRNEDQSHDSDEEFASKYGEAAVIKLPKAPPTKHLRCLRRFLAHHEPAGSEDDATLQQWYQRATTPGQRPTEKALFAGAAASQAAATLEAEVRRASALLPELEPPTPSSAELADRLHQRILLHQLPPIAEAASAAVQGKTRAATAAGLHPVAQQFFELLDSYSDIYLTHWTFAQAQHYRLAYVLHALNHTLRARDRAMIHTRQLAKAAVQQLDLDRRDQGFTRAKVCFLVPYRHQALLIVELLETLLVDRRKNRKEAHVRYKKKLLREYGLADPVKAHPNAEFNQYFAGNIDDDFCIGMTISRQGLNLYQELDQADIIVSSPLGLKRLVGPDEASRKSDFLSAIEVFIIDQASVMQMQNLEHLKDAVSMINVMPKERHAADIMRVRPYFLAGLARLFRQSVVLTEFPTPELNAMVGRQFINLSGRYRLSAPVVDGSICRVLVQVPQLFKRLEASSPATAPDALFNYFLEELLPALQRNDLKSHVLVVIPSYFDFVRLRNHMKRHRIECAMICEYTATSHVDRARDSFLKGERRFMLYTERFHFYRRPYLREIQHIIFYQLPLFPQLYAELLNSLANKGRRLQHAAPQSLTAAAHEDATVMVLYTKFDALRLTHVIGSQRAERLLTSERDTHMFY